MYFIFALIALFCWSGSDLFTKLGTNQNDKHSQWRVIFAVGVIMGIHALLTIIISQFINPDNIPDWILPIIYTDFKPVDFIRYLPVAFIYLSAMVIGYVGLRYIELSVSSPICNSSGSLAFVICAILGIACLEELSGLELAFTIIGVVLITVGIIALGFTEYKEDEKVKLARYDKTRFKYSKSIIAIIIPVVYLIVDALGTVGDQVISSYEIFEISEYASNTAFEFTSLCFALFAFVFIKFIKKEKFFIYKKHYEKPLRKYMVLGGVCETVGQVFYMSVMFSDFSAGMPIISAYCVISALWSRIFIKEKLSYKHYICIFTTILGIILLGIFSPI